MHRWSVSGQRQTLSAYPIAKDTETGLVTVYDKPDICLTQTKTYFNYCRLNRARDSYLYSSFVSDVDLNRFTYSQ